MLWGSRNTWGKQMTIGGKKNRRGETIAIKQSAFVVFIGLTVGLCCYCDATAMARDNNNQTASLPQAAARIRDEPESVWVEFVELGLKNKPLNLGQGFPDFAAPPFLIDSLHNATQQVALNQYTRSFGHPRLINALTDYYSRARHFSQLSNPNKQVLVTVGAYEALFCSVMAFVEPGDQVLIVEPAFDAYKPMVEMAQGRPVFVPLRRQANSTLSSASFKLDMSELEAKVAGHKTKMLILNTPNNPLGKAFGRDELVELADFCKRHNLLVLADEVYEQLYFEGQSEHLSIAQLPDMWRRTITVGSAGKTFSVTGWKIGWALGPAELIKYVQLIHQTTLYTVATPLQEAIAQAFERETELSLSKPGERHYWSNLRSDLLRKRDRMAQILARSGLDPILPEAGYFMLADVSRLARAFAAEIERDEGVSEAGASGRPLSSDYRVARWLSNARKLQVIPASAFYYAPESKRLLGSKMVRFCFIKSDATLDRLELLMRGLKRDLDSAANSTFSGSGSGEKPETQRSKL